MPGQGGPSDAATCPGGHITAHGVGEQLVFKHGGGASGKIEGLHPSRRAATGDHPALFKPEGNDGRKKTGALWDQVQRAPVPVRMH
ncbi:hypothetical protein DSCA_28330 [Desulfosarcina alkanivorans]|uniref:Uncharacterized protein n=1 Tax=Desulfosarcina alkanivorans TaxID=571177 RepID=A0A5K7YK70_9BACT|nr:hypothetical protein DSCA_28330 [Desulfosarcina alkanivorans]